MPDPLTVALLLALFGVDPLRPSAAAAPGMAFACEDGTRLLVSYPSPDRAVLTWEDGSTATLAQAVSADGARYVGGGWQWWGKGMDQGTLAPLAAGEGVASAEGTACAAP